MSAGNSNGSLVRRVAGLPPAAGLYRRSARAGSDPIESNKATDSEERSLLLTY